MECRNDGLTVWYGTIDAPASARSVTVGARPAHPGNTVTVSYRVDGGQPRQAPAVAFAGTVFDGGATQYFRAGLPAQSPDAVVEVLAVLSCGGRCAPSPAGVGATSPYWLRCPPPSIEPSSPSPPPSTTPVPGPRFARSLEFLGAVTAQLAPPERIGTTGGLLRVFHVASGTWNGPRVNATIRSGADWLLIRRDGVAIPNVRVTWETNDGALLFSEYYGIFDLGEQGHDDALRDHYPHLPTAQLAPRFVTSDARYAWLTRVQCLGIGQVDMERLVVRYDLYAVRGGEALPAPLGVRPPS